MVRECDHTSVGLLLWKDDRLLLIERGKPPFGFAPPAGHVDDRESYESAARQELTEEVGLEALELKLVAEGRKNNPCRRPNGTWHHWKIYEVFSFAGSLSPSPSETKRVGWYDRTALLHLASRTAQYLEGKLDQSTWEASPGLEPVWYDWLTELDILAAPTAARTLRAD